MRHEPSALGGQVTQYVTSAPVPAGGSSDRSRQIADRGTVSVGGFVNLATTSCDRRTAACGLPPRTQLRRANPSANCEAVCKGSAANCEPDSPGFLRPPIYDRRSRVCPAGRSEGLAAARGEHLVVLGFVYAFVDEALGGKLFLLGFEVGNLPAKI